jgi:hypothetical protein
LSFLSGVSDDDDNRVPVLDEPAAANCHFGNLLGIAEHAADAMIEHQTCTVTMNDQRGECDL